MDDLMMSYEDNFEITKFLCYLANIYGAKLAMHFGNKHDYLGMDFEFMGDKSLEMSMLVPVIDHGKGCNTGGRSSVQRKGR